MNNLSPFFGNTPMVALIVVWLFVLYMLDRDKLIVCNDTNNVCDYSEPPSVSVCVFDVRVRPQ